MLREAAATAEFSGSMGRLPPAEGTDLAIESVLTKDAAAEGITFAIALREACGAIEVRVSGARAVLRLSFDRADLHPPYVRHVVRAAVKCYRSSLDRPSSSLGKE